VFDSSTVIGVSKRLIHSRPFVTCKCSRRWDMLVGDDQER
jgi:hypothetical protein